MDEFKKGQKVLALLDEKHSTDSGVSVDHKAKFLRYHLDRQWADVELEAQHAGGSKLLSVPVSLLMKALILCIVLCSAFPVRAQFIGYTSPQTVTQTAFTNQAGAATFSVQNLGQNMHFVSYTSSGVVNLLDLRIEGSNDGVNFFPISDDAIDVVAKAGVLYAVGYYPAVRVNLAALAGGGTISANYTGTSGSSSPPTGNTYTSGMQSRKTVFTTVAMNANQNATILTPYSSSAGYLFIVSTTGTFPAGSTISVANQIASSAFSFPLGATSLTGLSQLLTSVPGSPASSISVSYVSGGASANTFNLFYIFTPNGITPSSPATLAGQSANGASLSVAPGNWSAVSNPAAGTQGSASRAAGAAGVRHVANCISFSAGSIVAPALTALTVNLRDGASGVGTIIWTHEVIIPATTGEDTPPVNLCGLNIVGTAATAMTLEWSAALANLSEAVSLSGYDVGP